MRARADYLLVVVVALVLSGANVVGYTKCSKEASQQLRNLAAQAVSSGFTVRLLSRSAPYMYIDVSRPGLPCSALSPWRIQPAACQGITYRTGAALTAPALPQAALLHAHHAARWAVLLPMCALSGC